MLLDFKFKNFKSFKDEADFFMTAAPKQQGLNYSVTEIVPKVKGRKKTIKALCSSVIYGANAAGKTNVISAMDVFRSIFLRGNIRNTEDFSPINIAPSRLDLIPNKNEEASVPVEFYIKFYEQDILIEYTLHIALGAFLGKESERHVSYEKLCVNHMCVFERTSLGNSKDTIVSIDELDAIGAFLPKDNNGEELKTSMDLINATLDEEELFICNGFKNQVSKQFYSLVYKWFSTKFIVILRADSMAYTPRFFDPERKGGAIDYTLNDAAKLFGINSNDLVYEIDKEDGRSILCSVVEGKHLKKPVLIPSELFESYGTIRFVNIFPIILTCLMSGGTLVVDEFDASLHPMALMNIVNLFHNDDVNTFHAQLVFDTHNPIFLNSNLFRRDEIKFVERDDETHNSTLYSLADFKTADHTRSRLHSDYMKNYFINQYGAINDIDFTPVVENIMKNFKS